jgi:hypothetical protein
MGIIEEIIKTLVGNPGNEEEPPGDDCGAGPVEEPDPPQEPEPEPPAEPEPEPEPRPEPHWKNGIGGP